MLAKKLIATALTAIVLSVAAINGVPSRVAALEQPNGSTALKGLTGIAASAANGETLYAAADGKLYRSADAGMTWDVETLPADAHVGVVGIDPAMAQRVYAGDAQRSEIYWYSPQSKAWLPVELAVSNNSTAVESGGIVGLVADHSGHVYAATRSDGVYQMVLENNALRSEAHSLSGYPVAALALDDAGRAYVLSNGQVLKSPTEVGGDWQAFANLPSRATAMTVGSGNPAPVYVGTESMGLLRSTDNGQTWQPSNVGLNEQPGARLTVTALAVDPNNSRLLYAATAYWLGDLESAIAPGEVAMSGDGGATWTQISGLEQVADHLAPSPAAPTRVFATAPEGDAVAVRALALTPALSTAPVAAVPVHNSAVTQSPLERWLGVDLSPMQWLSWGVALLALAMLGAILFTKPQPVRSAQAGR